MTQMAQEYIIMASGEIITWERIETWAKASGENVSALEAKMLKSGWLAKNDGEDFLAQDTSNQEV